MSLVVVSAGLAAAPMHLQKSCSEGCVYINIDKLTPSSDSNELNDLAPELLKWRMTYTNKDEIMVQISIWHYNYTDCDDLVSDDSDNDVKWLYICTIHELSFVRYFNQIIAG